jgi:hypothetical protein
MVGVWMLPVIAAVIIAFDITLSSLVQVLIFVFSPASFLSNFRYAAAPPPVPVSLWPSRR